MAALFHHVLEIVHLADHAGGAVLCVGAFAGGCIGITAVNGKRWDAIPAVGMRPLQAHCHSGLGTVYATVGQREQARTALSTAIAMHRAIEMMFWLRETEAALAQVEGQ
jgi:hypothetical protein